MASDAFDLATFPVHLGLGATCIRQEAFTGDLAWYEAYGKRHAADGSEARLVSLFTFSSSWDTWEMHPNGSELVICVAGSLVVHQERDGETTRVALRAGQAIINPPGVWHTADVDESATALFITAGAGTQIRPR